MTVREYPDGVTFLQETSGLLLEREAENCLIVGYAPQISICSDSGLPYCLSVSDHGHIVAGGVRTRPDRNFVLCACSHDAKLVLVEHIRRRDPHLRGISAPALHAQEFAAVWHAATASDPTVAYELGIYECDRVVPPAGVTGSVRIADLGDERLVIDWGLAFSIESVEPSTEEEIRVWSLPRLQQERVFLWQVGGKPVSMAVYGNDTVNGTRVSAVYTPPEHRGNGYASANVAAMTSHILNSRKFAYLFTDLKNPISNSIYRKIGYRFVCDFLDLRFS